MIALKVSRARLDLVVAFGLGSLLAGLAQPPGGTVAAPLSQALRYVVNASRSTHVATGVSSTIDDAPIRVGWWAGTETIGYLQFDPLPLDRSAPVEVLSATLRLYCVESDLAAPGASLFHLRAIARGWPSSYANRPPTIDPPLDWPIDGCAEGQRWQELGGPELRAIVQGWYDDASSNHGLELRKADRLSDARRGFQRAGPDNAHPLGNAPQLVLEIRDPRPSRSPTPTLEPSLTPSPPMPPTATDRPSPRPSPTSIEGGARTYLPRLARHGESVSARARLAPRGAGGAGRPQHGRGASPRP